MRTPGKFKAEFCGYVFNFMICLYSKMYTIWKINSEGILNYKTSCKGGQITKEPSKPKRNTLLTDHFLSVLKTQQPQKIENSGFIKDGTSIKTYTQSKKVLGYFYGKREVLDDGISTIPLKTRDAEIESVSVLK